MAFFCKSYGIGLIWVYAEFFFALKTEPKSMVFEKHAKNGEKKLSSLFFMIFTKSLV